MASLHIQYLALLFSLTASACHATSGAAHTLVDPRSRPALNIKVGDPFLATRARITKAGWRPMRIDRGEYGISGTETLLANRKINEFESCSMDLGTLCAFFYRKRGACLRVDTVGEQLRDIKVTRWTKECPQPFG